MARGLLGRGHGIAPAVGLGGVAELDISPKHGIGQHGVAPLGDDRLGVLDIGNQVQRCRIVETRGVALFRRPTLPDPIAETLAAILAEAALARAEERGRADVVLGEELYLGSNSVEPLLVVRMPGRRVVAHV